VTLYHCLTWSKSPGFPDVVVKSGRLHAYLAVYYAAVSHVHFPSCRVWDVNDGSIVNTLAHHSDAVYCLKFNSDTLVTGSEVLCIFVPTYMYSNSKTGYEVFAATYFKHEEPINPQQISHVRVLLGECSL